MARHPNNVRRIALHRAGPKPQQLVRLLTYAERAIIIKHIDMALPLTRSNGAMLSLMRAGIITNLYGGRRTRHTRLTELGRAVSAALLADYADSLIAARFTPVKLARYMSEHQPIRLAPEDTDADRQPV